jgi:hypothetical protein
VMVQSDPPSQDIIYYWFGSQLDFFYMAEGPKVGITSVAKVWLLSRLIS